MIRTKTTAAIIRVREPKGLGYYKKNQYPTLTYSIVGNALIKSYRIRFFKVYIGQISKSFSVPFDIYDKLTFRNIRRLLHLAETI